MAIDGKAVALKLEKVSIPERLLIKATILKGERVGIILETAEQRKTLARKILGYEPECSGVYFEEGAIINLSEPSLANIRARVSVNLPASDLCPGGIAKGAVARVARKVEKADTLLQAFETHAAYLLQGMKHYAGSQVFTETRERFFRWLAAVGLRHATPAKKLAPKNWRYFWLAVALAFGRRLVVLVDPLTELDLMDARKTMDALQSYMELNKDIAMLMLSESGDPPLKSLCRRWVGKKS